MKVISYGAAKTVTGSTHMLVLDDKKILIDCGLFQGVDEEKSEELGFDPKEVDAVLLTHAHIDHCGRLPMLVKNGFKGKIYCTNPTYELSRLMLLDTAKVMLENYKSHMRRFQRGSIKEMPLEPLYDEDMSSIFRHYFCPKYIISFIVRRYDPKGKTHSNRRAKKRNG